MYALRELCACISLNRHPPAHPVRDALSARASECHGIMEPISVWVRKNGEWAVIHRCKVCGKLSSNRVAADDSPVKLMSIAMRPVAEPPFPLERIKEITDLMFKSKDDDIN